MKTFNIYSGNFFKENISLREIYANYNLTEVEFNDLCVMDIDSFLSVGAYMTIVRIV